MLYSRRTISRTPRAGSFASYRWCAAEPPSSRRAHRARRAPPRGCSQSPSADVSWGPLTRGGGAAARAEPGVQAGVPVERRRVAAGREPGGRGLGGHALQHGGAAQVGLDGDERVPRGGRRNRHHRRRSVPVEGDVVAGVRRAHHVLRRRWCDNRGDVALLRRRPLAVGVHRGHLLAHHDREPAVRQPVQRLLHLHQGAPRARDPAVPMGFSPACITRSTASNPRAS